MFRARKRKNSQQHAQRLETLGGSEAKGDITLRYKEYRMMRRTENLCDCLNRAIAVNKDRTADLTTSACRRIPWPEK